MGLKLKPHLYFILLGYVGQLSITEKEWVLGSEPTWLSLFHLEDLTAIFQKVLQGLVLMRMIPTAPIY